MKRKGAIQRLFRREHRQNIISAGVEQLAVEGFDHLTGTVEAEVAQRFGESRVESGRQRATNRISLQSAGLGRLPVLFEVTLG